MSSVTLSESRRAAAEPPASALPKPGGASALRPAHFFTGATLAVAAAAVVVLRGAPFVEMVLALFTIGGAGLAAFALYTMLAPLTAARVEEGVPLVEGRTRAALERDKALTLRSLKELEFDRAMGKISEPDFQEMRARLRARAVRLIQQLEGASTYREMIERDLREMPLPALHRAAGTSPVCTQCGTANDADARFCKMCGHALR